MLLIMGWCEYFFPSVNTTHPPTDRERERERDKMIKNDLVPVVFVKMREKRTQKKKKSLFLLR